MQSEPSAPSAPEGPSAETTAGEADGEAVARIVAHWRERHPLAPGEIEDVERTVEQALRELGGGADAPPPGSEPTRPVPRGEEANDLRRWRRFVLALVAAALIWLFWHRLAWIG